MGDSSLSDKKLLFRVFESYFSILGNRSTGSVPDLPLQHSIELKTEAPVVCGSRRLPYSLRDEVAVKIKELLDQGVVRSSTSSFAAPIVPVRKNDNSLRLCIDYRRLNAATIPKSYLLPRIEDLTEKVKGCSVFTVLDLGSAYHNIKMREEDVGKTAFVFGEKKYEIVNFKTPNNLAELQSFLCMCAFLRRFVDNFAQNAAPLRELLKKKTKFVWDSLCEQAFQIIKYSLQNLRILTLSHPAFDKLFFFIAMHLRRVLGSLWVKW